MHVSTACVRIFTFGFFKYSEMTFRTNGNSTNPFILNVANVFNANNANSPSCGDNERWPGWFFGRLYFLTAAALIMLFPFPPNMLLPPVIPLFGSFISSPPFIFTPIPIPPI